MDEPMKWRRLKSSPRLLFSGVPERRIRWLMVRLWSAAKRRPSSPDFNLCPSSTTRQSHRATLRKTAMFLPSAS